MNSILRIYIGWHIGKFLGGIVGKIFGVLIIFPLAFIITFVSIHLWRFVGRLFGKRRQAFDAQEVSFNG